MAVSSLRWGILHIKTWINLYFRVVSHTLHPQVPSTKHDFWQDCKARCAAAPLCYGIEFSVLESKNARDLRGKTKGNEFPLFIQKVFETKAENGMAQEGLARSNRWDTILVCSQLYRWKMFSPFQDVELLTQISSGCCSYCPNPNGWMSSLYLTLGYHPAIKMSAIFKVEGPRILW